VEDKAVMRVLILGGTSEAANLAGQLAGDPAIAAVLSLAGRTGEPKPAPVPTRIGGFGGAAGLTRYLAEKRIDAVVDATHPFADTISRSAAEACRAAGVALLAIRRPPWHAGPGDRWIDVASMLDAAAALGDTPRRVFLTVGRLELAAFATAPQHHYLVRTIEPIGDALPVPSVTALQARGPFNEAEELGLLRAHAIDVVVTKNSGGSATYGKIAAARTLALPVVIVARPDKPDVEAVEDADAAFAWLSSHAPSP
jgi:precorrin-6A/cobalt-precorrin-6A reductase